MKFRSWGFGVRSKKQRIILRLLPFTFYLFTLLGCAMLKEAGKKFLGVSTKELQDLRKTSITRQFNYDYNTCYEKVKEALKEKGAYIYAQGKRKHMIAFYVSEEDTTPVGIFFNETDANKTQIEVSSPSSYAKEAMALKIFSALEQSLALENAKGVAP